MAFCKNCGNQLSDDASFCTNCGTPVDNAQQAEPQQTYQQAAPQQPVQTQAMDPDAPLPGEKGLAWLAYVLWAPAFLVPLFVKKASPYCQFHVKQGATLWAVHIAYYIVQCIIGAIFGSIIVASRYNGGVIALTRFYPFFFGQATSSLSYSRSWVSSTPQQERKMSFRLSARSRGSQCLLIRSTRQ
jgi:hypothetical protein